jgi:hypothetical protein
MAGHFPKNRRSVPKMWRYIQSAIESDAGRSFICSITHNTSLVHLKHAGLVKVSRECQASARGRRILAIEPHIFCKTCRCVFSHEDRATSWVLCPHRCCQRRSVPEVSCTTTVVARLGVTVANLAILAALSMASQSPT